MEELNRIAYAKLGSVEVDFNNLWEKLLAKVLIIIVRAF